MNSLKGLPDIQWILSLFAVCVSAFLCSSLFHFVSFCIAAKKSIAGNSVLKKKKLFVCLTLCHLSLQMIYLTALRLSAPVSGGSANVNLVTTLNS